MPFLDIFPDIYAPTFVMKVDNRALADQVAKTIQNISVTQTLNPPNDFSFQFYDPKLELIAAQGGVFQEGSLVEISIGFVKNPKPEKLITGEITALSVEFPDNGAPTVRVEGMDLLHRLTRGNAYRTFGERANDNIIPDHQIVETIAGEMGLSPSVNPTDDRTEPRVQKFESNLTFLKRIADEDNYFLWVEDTKLYFKSARPAPNTIELKLGEKLINFSARLSTANQVMAVEVVSSDHGQKQIFDETAPRSSTSLKLLGSSGITQIKLGTGGQSKFIKNDTPVSSAEKAKTLAQATMREQEETLITGSGASVGRPDMRAGTILDLQSQSEGPGLGRFAGEYIVTQVTHALGGNGYQTSFQVIKKV